MVVVSAPLYAMPSAMLTDAGEIMMLGAILCCKNGFQEFESEVIVGLDHLGRFEVVVENRVIDLMITGRCG